MRITVPEQYKLVDALLGCVTTNGGVTGDWVTLKNSTRVTIAVTLKQAVGHATLITVQQATAVAGTSAKALSRDCLIWANEDVSATDTLVRQTDAKNYTVAATAKAKTVYFEIDPATCLDIANGFDCINVILADSSQATNFACATYMLHANNMQATPPTAITD